MTSPSSPGNLTLCLDEYDGVDGVGCRRHGRVIGIEAEIAKDLASRQQLGIVKYGQTVANNPLELRAWLQHALEECLDQAIYLRRAIAEIDDQGPRYSIDEIADACVGAEISDSKFESLSIGLAATLKEKTA